MLSHLWGKGLSPERWGQSEITASLDTRTSPMFCPVHGSFWGLDSGEGTRNGWSTPHPRHREAPALCAHGFICLMNLS